MKPPDPQYSRSRRRFLAGAATLSASLFVRGMAAELMARETSGNHTLRIQRLAWAGIKLQMDGGTLFVDPLVNPDVWGPALKDKIVSPDAESGDRFVLVTHRHSFSSPIVVVYRFGSQGLYLSLSSSSNPDSAPGAITSFTPTTCSFNFQGSNT
jgi:hypothetical protein